jgi:hypothetical protein
MSSDEKLREDFARRINSAWRKSVTAIIEAGRLLVEAKTKLKPGTFTEMVIVDLAFDLSTAERLMKISRTSWLVESATLPILPPAWTTLYALSQLTAKEFKQARELGWIRSEMTLAQAERLKGVDQKIEAKLTRNQHTCNVVQFEKPDDVVELSTEVEVEREQVSVEAQATIILGYLRQALDRIERCDDDQEQAKLVDAIIKHAHFQDTVDALDRVLALLKQAADDRPKPSLAVNNDAASPLHG